MIIHLVLQGQDDIKLNDMRIAVEYVFDTHVTKETVKRRNGQTYQVTGRHGMWSILDADRDRYSWVGQYHKGRFFEYMFNGSKWWWCGKNKRQHPSVIIDEKISAYFSLKNPPIHNWDKPRMKGDLYIIDPKITVLKHTEKSGWEVIR